jgi:hypothetical protein
LISHRRVVCFFLLASSAAIACDTYFQSGNPITLTGAWASSFAVGDFDRDGKQDIALGLAQGGITISGLSATHQYPTAGPVTGITAADFNRDGLLDIAYADQTGVAGILLGNGDGTFRTGSNFPLPFSPSAIAAIDLNGDSVPDLVLGSVTVPYLNSLIGDGSGGFQVGTSSAGGVEVRTLAVLPGTPDSPPYIVSGNFHQLFVFNASANGALVPSTLQMPASLVSYFAQTTTADVNGDGYLDLVIGGNGVSVFILPHGGVTPSAVHFSTDSLISGIAVGDVNGDEKPDLITSTSSQVKVLIGDGLGNFILSPNYAGVGYPAPIAAAYFDVISRADVILLASNGVFLRPNCYDVTPPSTTATLSTPPNANGWNNTPVKINLQSTDGIDGSGVLSMAYSLSGAVTTGPSYVTGANASVDVGVQGLTTITYQAKDNNWNIEQPKSLSVRIDTTAPAVSGLPVPGCSVWPPNEQMVEIANVASADTLSGTNSLVVTGSVNYPADANESPDIVVNGGTVTVRARPPRSGNPIVYTVTAVATDKAGNSSTLSGICKVDK